MFSVKIYKVKTQYWKLTHKFRIGFPKSVLKVIETNNKNENTFCRDSIENYIRNVMLDFQFFQDGANFPIGYQHIKFHIFFDVYMYFTWKACLVTRGHITQMPVSLTYSSVVSRASVRVSSLLAALNDLCVLACETGNTYLNSHFLNLPLPHQIGRGNGN